MSDYRVVEINDPDDPLIDALHDMGVRIDGPDTRCTPEAAVPSTTMMRNNAKSVDGMRLWAVLDTAFDDAPVAMIITGPDGEFKWLKASMDNIGPVTYVAGQHITSALGVRAWGTMRNSKIRQAIADAGPRAGVNHDEQRVWWNG